jgi:hypothetical protein
MIVIMQPLQSVQMPIIKIKHLLCSPLTALPNHYLMLHRHWRIHMLRSQRVNNHFLIVFHRFGTNIYVILLGNWKTIAIKLIYPLLWQQFSILRLFFKTKMMKFLTLNPQMRKMSIHAFRILNDFLRALPHCPIIRWASQMCNDPMLCVCPCSKHSSPWRENNKIFIHQDHECKVGLMTPQELLRHLRS